MAAHSDRTVEIVPDRNVMPFCPECGHESVNPGDWRTERTDDTMTCDCPDRGSTVVGQQRPVVPPC